MPQQLTEQQALAFANDPTAFIRYYWPDATCYHKQVEVMLSVRDNVETFVHAGHKLGKDRIAAWIALWFFCTRKPARVIISSSSSGQLEDTLFAEINEQIRAAAAIGRPLPVAMNHMHIRKPIPGQAGQYEALDYIKGKVVKLGESISGHHLDSSRGPRVLVILSEASGIEDIVYNSVITQRHRLLVTGNPLTDNGFFARLCLAGDLIHPGGPSYGLMRKIIHIDGERDSPNVIYGKRWTSEKRFGLPATILPGVLSYSEFLERLTMPPDERRGRLHGLFPSQGASHIYTSEVLDFAARIWAKINAEANAPIIKRGRRAMGVDVAAGGDWTVWTIVDRFGVVQKERRKTPNTAIIPGITIKLADRAKINPEDILFDSGGGGLNEANHLRDKGYAVQDVSFAAKSNYPDEYRSMRAELYGEAAKMMALDAKTIAMTALPLPAWLKGWVYMAIPPDDILLRQDLAVLPKKFDGEERLVLPPKNRKNTKHGANEKTVVEMLGWSPDDGDSFVLACYAFRMMKERLATTYVDRPMAY
jgi:hypothetical protein